MIITINIDCRIEEAKEILKSIGMESKIELNIDTVKEFNRKKFSELVPIEKIELIISLASNLTKESTENIKSKSRKLELIKARMIATYLCYHYTRSSLKEIGQAIGGRDHSTIISSANACKDQMETDFRFNDMVKLAISEVLKLGFEKYERENFKLER